MTTLGKYPSHRYSRSWVVQRLFNRFPEWMIARRNAFDVGQQFLNPIALDLQDTFQQLTIEKYNWFLSLTDLSSLDHLYKISLSPGMEFNSVEDSSGNTTYTPPTVYSTIDGTEYQLTQAEFNDVQSLAYNNLPSRIEDPEINYSYDSVIEETLISELSAATINSLPIPGHLYITLKNNSIWQVETPTKLFFSKISITGITRKETEVTETIPVRYNGTFKTLNEWKEITSIEVFYLEDPATVTVELFSWSAENILDTLGINITPDGQEKLQFFKLGTQDFGSTFVVESFTSSDMDVVRNISAEDKETVYELELLDDSLSNVSLSSFVRRPNSRFIYCIDDSKFYVYDISLPFPDVMSLTEESPEAKVDLYSDQWIIPKGNLATIKTRNLDELEVPYKIRWTLLDPDGDTYYLGVDGSLWSTTIDAWIENELWEDGRWREQYLQFEVTKSGTYTLTLECFYTDDFSNSSTLNTKFLIYAPSITPEVEIDLPTLLEDSTEIGIDSDHSVWLLKDETLNKLNIFFDYFLIDYKNKKIWLKEEYNSSRVVL